MLTHQKPAQYRISVSQKKRSVNITDCYCLIVQPVPRFILLRFYGTHHRIIFSFFTDHIFIFNFILMLAQIFPDLMYFRLWLQNQFFRCTADGFPFRQNMQNQFSTHSCNQNGIRFIWKQCLCPVRKPGLYIFLQPGCPDMFLCPGKRSLINIHCNGSLYFLPLYQCNRHIRMVCSDIRKDTAGCNHGSHCFHSPR